MGVKCYQNVTSLNDVSGYQYRYLYKKFGRFFFHRVQLPKLYVHMYKRDAARRIFSSVLQQDLFERNLNEFFLIKA